jgi:hypothetical protein
LNDFDDANFIKRELKEVIVRFADGTEMIAPVAEGGYVRCTTNDWGAKNYSIDKSWRSWEIRWQEKHKETDENSNP